MTLLAAIAPERGLWQDSTIGSAAAVV